MSSGTEGNTEGKQGGTDVEDDSSGILPFPLGGRPEITRVLQLLLQLPESLPCFRKTLKVKWEEPAARQMEKADWYRCGDGNDRTVPEEPGEF